MYIHPVGFFADERFRVDPTLCFVIMPFGRPWSNQLFETVREAVEGAGYACRRGDDYYGRIVLSDVWERLNEAAIVVADLTSENPNVYYELGIAHTLGKDIIPLIQVGSTVPFDQQPFRVLIYEDSAEGYAALRERLPRWVNAIEFDSSPQMLLRRGTIDRFNRWRERHAQVDLSDADLSGLDLSGAILADVVLRGANLSGSVLDRVDLSRAKLTSADLRNARLSAVIAPDSHISEASIVGGSLEHGLFERTTMIRSDLTNVRARWVNLAHANLSEANLAGADLRSADLRGGIWLRVNLAGARLQDADVAGLTIDKATWERNASLFEAAKGVEDVVVEA